MKNGRDRAVMRPGLLYDQRRHHPNYAVFRLGVRQNDGLVSVEVS